MFKSNTLKLIGLAAALTAAFVSVPSHATLCQYCSFNGPSLEGHAQTDAKARVVVAIVLPE